MHLCFEEAVSWEVRKRAVFHQINQSDLPLVLFGKSPVIQPDFLQQLTVPVQYICDNDPEKWGTKQWGMEVIEPDKLSKLYSFYNVLILVPFEQQIVPQLMGLPVPPAEVFRLDLYFEERGTAAYFQRNQTDIEEIYDCLSDQQSKDTYEAVIQYRISRDPAILTSISLPRKTQYFPDSLGEIQFLHSNEVFVDAGAFIGDTIQAFYSTVHGQYSAIHAIEPERKNYEKLIINTNAFPGLTYYRSVIGDHIGEIRFSSEDSSSRADQSGTEIIPIQTLDSLLKGVPVTFLKMDVEGMECAALQGAKAVIQTFHPKLAICTYHSDADMVQVPKLIKQLDPTYKLYFRHYTNALVETVCYAI